VAEKNHKLTFKLVADVDSKSYIYMDSV